MSVPDILRQWCCTGEILYKIVWITTAIFLFAILIVLLASPSDKTATIWPQGCHISILNDLPTPDKQPLILHPEKENGDFVYPGAMDSILLKKDQGVLLACPGKDNELTGAAGNNAIVSCIDGTGFNLKKGSQTIKTNIAQLKCKSTAASTAKKTTEKCGEQSDKAQIEIGFEIADRFVRTILLCFDEVKYETLWSQYKLTKEIGDYPSRLPRPIFQEGDFYKNLDQKISELYSKTSQILALTKILGAESTAKKYINGENMLSRGHLTARADFVYESMRSSTFWYVNAAPQWQSFNNGNWNQLEMDIRRFAASKALDLEVYTGTYGVTTLLDKDNKPKDVYLYVDTNNNGVVSVPKLFWKVIYDPASKLGTAFIALNNPYNDLAKEDTICTNICSNIKWLEWKADDKSKGFAYCCDVNELTKIIKYIPKLEVKGILK